MLGRLVRRTLTAHAPVAGWLARALPRLRRRRGYRPERRYMRAGWIALSGEVVRFRYVNSQGHASVREARAEAMRFGSSEYHRTPQWLMLGRCLDRGEDREFAMADMVVEEVAPTVRRPTRPRHAPTPEELWALRRAKREVIPAELHPQTSPSP
jgi:hypothetical protein